MDTPPVALPRSLSWDMTAGGDPARRYRLALAWPEEPPPPEGYPVLLVLDANPCFATAVEAYRALRWRSTAPPPPPALILGLGHGGGEGYDPPARQRDYTPPLPGQPLAGDGAEAFLDFIASEVLPALATRHPVDRTRLALFGHSLGGLFATYALLARPGLFHAIIAASPSLWWEDGLAMEAARRFAAAPPAAAAGTRLLVTVGGLEESNNGPRGPLRVSRRMIARARALAALLREAGLDTDFLEFPGEDHGSAKLHALLRATRFALCPAGETL